MNRIPKTTHAQFTIALLLILQMTAAAQSDCELRKEKDNIKIYSCKTEESDFNAIRAEFEVHATIDKYISTVLDVDRYKEWRHREINHRLLKKISDTELIYYTQIVAPFPVSNRDLILHLRLNQDAVTKVLTVTLECLADYLPLTDDVVRVPESTTKMTLTPIDDSRFKVIYFVQVDPGGQIPAWIANTFGVQAPYETFKNLIRRLEEK